MSGVAQNDCEHHFGSHVRGGEPLHVRTCTLCHAVDWADLREQLAPLTARVDRAEAAIERVTAWLDTWSALDRRGYVTVGLVADEVRAALDSTDPVEAAPDSGHRWNSEGTCRRCWIVRGTIPDSAKCGGRPGVFFMDAAGQLDAPAPTRSGEESRTVGEAVGDAIRKAMPSRSDAGLPADGEERK